MVNLQLSAEEQAVLRDALESSVSELGTEISNTDSKDYRDALKQRREILQKVIGALGGEEAAPGHPAPFPSPSP